MVQEARLETEVLLGSKECLEWKGERGLVVVMAHQGLLGHLGLMVLLGIVVSLASLDLLGLLDLEELREPREKGEMLDHQGGFIYDVRQF